MISPSLDEAFDRVRELADDFHKHRAAYMRADYSEAQARQDFIDKFLTALGWDVAHNHQRNPFEQEVRVERNVDVGHSQKRADYAFYIKPNFRDVRFYVEAKRPSAVLETKDNYFQAIRYGWNSGTPIVFLTDFEGTHVLDCRYRPDIDTALQRCLLKLHYSEYRDKDKFAKLYFLLSRDAVADGAQEKFAASFTKRGRSGAIQRGLFRGGFQSIDETFLTELDEHRDALARSLKTRNPELDGDALTELVQRILDRLVFLRFLEDKLIETTDSVAQFGSKSTAWADFQHASRRLDNKYNGIVYKAHPLIDTERLDVDEDVFAGICEDLADVNNPYNFDLIPIHILGSIYERFLGKVIVTTDKRARVEEKPEVRKAGGVYYTPEYIVRYIVENTVGRLIAGKTPTDVAKMRFADIACGSGSFLLGIFDCLLRFHRDWYNANPKKLKKGECWQDDDGHYRLTLSKRREILLNNIYGVDVDPQAVEVAQLSVYLKLLEEETTATASGYQQEMHAALLPALSRNIVCGNSILEPKMLQSGLFGDDLERKVNPMSFEARFSTIMAAGGFDAIVGNPPYVNAWELYESQPEMRELLNHLEAYSMADRHWDLYVLFLERALSKVRTGGFVGYIIPFSFAIQKYAEKARKYLLERCRIESILDLRAVRVFGKVPVITIVPIVSKVAPAAEACVEIRAPLIDNTGTFVGVTRRHETAQTVLHEQHESMLRLDLSPTSLALIDRVRTRSLPLGDLCYVNYGAQMSSKKKGAFGKGEVIHAKKKNLSFKPVVSGRELFRYEIRWSGRFVDYSRAPEMYGPRWPEFFEQPKLMVRDITGTHRIEATLDNSGYYCDHTILCAQRNCDVTKWKAFAPEDIHRSSEFSREFLAAVVASRIVSAFYYLVLTGEGVRIGGGFHTYPETIRQFPVPKLDFANRNHVQFHDRLGALAKRVLESRMKLPDAKTDRDVDYHMRRAEEAEAEIDLLLYEFYGLGAEAIRLVESLTIADDVGTKP